LSRRSNDGNRSAGTRGFTLIEVLIALAIAGLGMAALLAAAGTGLGTVRLADRYVEAARRAQSHLALVGVAVPVAAGERWGDDGGGFSWRVKISPPVAHATVPGGEPLPALYRVEVKVSWPEGGTAKSVTLRSERVARPVQGHD
jgi:prepilin-type N-terminal cleavage/methylation domain-containing protein